MQARWPKAGLAAALTFALLTPVRAEEKSNEDLLKEMESMRQMLQSIQKDLQEVKGMLATRQQAPPPSGIGAVLDLGAAPVKGEKTAKLTLVEFSDYQ